MGNINTKRRRYIRFQWSQRPVWIIIIIVVATQQWSNFWAALGLILVLHRDAERNGNIFLQGPKFDRSYLREKLTALRCGTGEIWVLFDSAYLDCWHNLNYAVLHRINGWWFANLAFNRRHVDVHHWSFASLGLRHCRLIVGVQVCLLVHEATTFLISLFLRLVVHNHVVIIDEKGRWEGLRFLDLHVEGRDWRTCRRV